MMVLAVPRSIAISFVREKSPKGGLGVNRLVIFSGRRN